MTHEPILQLYRNTEAAEPMAALWDEYLHLVQSHRGHLRLVCEWDLRPLEFSFRQQTLQPDFFSANVMKPKELFETQNGMMISGEPGKMSANQAVICM